MARLAPKFLLTSWQTSRSCFMEKNILTQEKLSAKVFSSPISRYPLFSMPAKSKVQYAQHLIGLLQVSKTVVGRGLTYLFLSRHRRQERLCVKF